MEKLELKHIVGYLPYGLKIYDGEYQRLVTFYHLTYHTDEVGLGRLFNPNYDFSMGMPILYPMSDLTKEIEVNGERKIISDYTLDKMSFNLGRNYLNTLFKYHFDVYGLINRGLAIDINTL